MSVSGLRDFNRRALDPQRSVVIEACAGSGKTWLLVSRVLRLLLAGVKPGQILAITFTRKAAQEMAARLREWLLELAMADDDAARTLLQERAVPESEIDALLPRARGLYEQSLTAQPPLTIATFHGWFLQLLKRAPFDAGVLGNAELVEQTAPLMADAWQRFAAAMQRDPASAAARGLDALFARYGMHSTRNLLLAFLRRRAEWWAYTRHLPDPDSAVEYALERMRANIDLDRDVCAELFADGSFAADVRGFAGLLARNSSQDGWYAQRMIEALELGDLPSCFERLWPVVLTVEGNARKRTPNKARAKRLGAADERRLLDLHESLSARLLEARRDFADQQSYRVNAAGLPAAVALLEAYRAVKEERQVIDFAYVECGALELLSSGDHAAFLFYKLDARYRHVLLDEFQDTNPLQWMALHAWFSAAGEADALPAIFMVGDPKQSIYRFRGAEARLFDHARDYLARHFDADAELTRDESRRCAPALIELVNATFALADGFHPHTAHYTAKRGRVEVLPLIPKDSPASSADAAGAPASLRNALTTPFADIEDLRREQEAAQLAATIHSIVGRWIIESDPRGDAARPADLRDIMVLVRQRTHLATYERALRAAEIPFVTAGRGGLLDTLEAKDVWALLQFLVSPFANLPLAQTLRAPIFACTDDDMVTLARARGDTWWTRLTDLAATRPQTLSPALSRAAKLLAGWLARADALPVHDQLDRIYFESDLLERYRAAVPSAMREAVVANLQALMQRALDTDAGRYPSLPRFIHELAELRDAPQQEAPDEGLIGDPGNAVRILTVHGAKGLESPVVCLIDTAAEIRTESAYDVAVSWEPDTRAPQHVSLWTRKAERSRAQQALADAAAVLTAREDTNLLYVAITRAKQALIVSGVETSRPEESWYSRIRAGAASLPGAKIEGDTIVLGADLTAATPSRPPIVAETPPADEVVAGPLNLKLPTGVRRDALTGRGRRYGSNFHRALELLTSVAQPPAELRARLKAELGLAESEFAPLWDQAQRVVSAPELARFFEPGRHLRATNEVAYCAGSGDIFRIDRLVEFENEVWVLDYKTGARVEIDDVRIEQYRAQVAGYLEAVKHAFPRQQVRAAIVFADASTLEVGTAPIC